MLTRRQFLVGAATVFGAVATGCKARLPLPQVNLFEAAAPPEPAPPLRVALLSDTHVEEPGMWAYNATYGKLKRALEDFKPYRPNYWLFNGDVTDDGKVGEFKVFKELVADYAKPEQILATTGNHEFYDKEATDEESLRRFMAAFGQEKPYSNRMLGDIHVVMLADEMWKSAPRFREWAWLTAEQLTWFERVLKEHKEKLTVVCLHQPLQETVVWSHGGNDFAGCGQVKELRAIIARNPQIRLWLSGHTHIRLQEQGQVVKQGNVTYACLGSTFYQFVPSDASEDQGGWPTVGGYKKNTSASQSRMLDVWPDRVVLRARDHAQEKWLDELAVTIPRL